MNGVVMKSLSSKLIRLAAVATFVAAAVVTGSAQDGRIRTAQLDALAAKASQTVDVNLDEKLMQFAAKFLSAKDPDEASVKDLVNGLKGIYVRSFEFDAEGQYSQADIESIRSQLKAAPWSRLVNVQSKREGSVEVYLMLTGSQVGGLAVLATDPKEITVVNIVGPVDLDKLSQLEGSFGVPDLGIERTKSKGKEKKEKEDEEE